VPVAIDVVGMVVVLAVVVFLIAIRILAKKDLMLINATDVKLNE